jgi:hypothetical protein
MLHYNAFRAQFEIGGSRSRQVIQNQIAVIVPYEENRYFSQALQEFERAFLAGFLGYFLPPFGRHLVSSRSSAALPA